MRVDLELAALGDVCVVRIAGEVDMAAADKLRAAVRRTSPANRIVLDLSAVTFMDSTGLAVIGYAKQLVVGSQDGWVRIAGAPRQVRRVVEVTGMDKVAPMFESVEDAINVGLSSPTTSAAPGGAATPAAL